MKRDSVSFFTWSQDIELGETLETVVENRYFWGMDEYEDEDEDAKPEYFEADRLIGILQEFLDLDGTEFFEVVELIHLTARFGAFRRESLRWESIWQGWNPNPDYVYINFKRDDYDNVVRKFDQSKNLGLSYSKVQEFREIRDWEGEFDLSESPHYFRRIEEVINHIQDFVEPRPKIITYGIGHVGCGDMAWMYPFVSNLEAQRDKLENFVLAQKRRSQVTVMEEQLLHIEMYPPLHDEVLRLFTEAANHVCDDEEEFEEFLVGTPYMKYICGGRISINQLNSYLSEFIALVVAHQSALTKQRVDSFRLTREVKIIPSHRLEAWFLASDDKFHQLVANTEFGLYFTLGRGKWRPLIRDYEIEDVYDLAGVRRIHIRPEAENSAITNSDQGGFSGKLITDHEFIKYQVEYRGEKSTSSDFYDRTPFARAIKIQFKSLKRIGATVIREMITELRADIKVILAEELQIDEIIHDQLILEDFLQNKVELSYRELYDLLSSCFYFDLEWGNGIQHLAEEIRSKNESRTKFEKLMNRRDVEYLPLSSMVLAVAYHPSVKVWLEYRSHYYGRFARKAGDWQTNIQPNSEISKELILYEVKEECVSDFVRAFDNIAIGSGSASFSDLASMLCILRMSKNANISLISNDDWDTESFTHKQMQPSTRFIFDSLYNQIQQHFEDKADSYLELSQDQLAQALVNDHEELSAIYGDEARKFVRKGEFLDREHLSRFMSGAVGILLNQQSAEN